MTTHHPLTNEHQLRCWQRGPLKYGVQNLLAFGVELIHLVQDKETGPQGGGRGTQGSPSKVLQAQLELE